MGIRNRIYALGTGLEQENGVARESGPFNFALRFEARRGTNLRAQSAYPEILDAAIPCPTFSKFRLASCSRY